jgi:Domain of unknown function (DUF4134)
MNLNVKYSLFTFFWSISQLAIGQANVDLGSLASNSSQLKGRINDPLYENAHVIVPFTMVIISILFLLYSFQIFNKWQGGEKNVIPMITRWVFGLCLFIVMITFLNAFIVKQDFKRTVKPHFEMQKFDLP